MKLHTLARPGAPRRTGTVIVVVAVCLIGILAFVALALDGGMLLDKRRQAQCASDAAALAAAYVLLRGESAAVKDARGAPGASA